MKRLPIFPDRPFPAVQTAQPEEKNPDCTKCVLHTGTQAGSRCLPAEGETGDILVVLGHPTEFEQRLGRPAASPSGRYLREMIARVAPGRKVVFTYALGCRPLPKMETKELLEPIEACRGYLHSVLRDSEAKVVLLFDSMAGLGFLGRSFQPLSVRKGYGWFFPEDQSVTMLAIKDPYGEARPAFLLGDPSYAMRNKLIARALEEDLRNALLRPLPTFGALSASYEVVETPEDSLEALEALGESAWLATDVEASGMLHEPDYRIECVAVSRGDRTFVWPRKAIEDPDVVLALGEILENMEHATWNGQYDLVAMECEPLIKGLQITKRRRWILNLQSDSRIKRKLFEADAVAKLEVSAELVGMGGHKEEAHDVIEEISDDLRKLALARHLTPKGKTRKVPTLKQLGTLKAPVPEVFLGYIDQGHRPQMLAYRYLDPGVMHRYCARDALATFMLEEWCNDRLIENPNLHMVWEEIAKPAMWAWCSARLAGFPVDRKRVELLKDYLDVEIEKLGKKIEAHEPGLNPNSPQQVAKALEKRGFRSKRTTATGMTKMDKGVMEDFKGKHPLVDLILAWKMFRHTQDNFVEGLIPYIRSDGKCHPSYLQDGTECMPAGELVLTEDGYKPVELVKVGDRVLTHEYRFRPVAEVNRFSPSTIYRVCLSNGFSLRTTGNHAYQLQNGEWRKAEDLAPGDMVRVYSQEDARRYDSEVTYLYIQTPEETFGLTVEEDHSHVTGGIVTHNTGRPSSADPNFFNRLKGRDEESRKLGTMLRECHIMPPGHTLIEADEGQIEIREVMDLCEDPTGIEIIASGVDFHMASAKRFAAVLGKDPEKVSDIDREQAKTCIAEGELVLTDHGLIPIENLDKNSKVWDGIAWVAHDGIVCHGLKRVISHDGLTATPDHHVYMPDGRCIPLEMAAMDGRLAVGGDGEVPVGYAPDDWKDCSIWEPERKAPGVPVLAMREDSTCVSLQRDGRQDDQLHLRGDLRGSSHPAAPEPLARDVLQVQQPELEAGQELRLSGDRMSVRELRSVCCLGSEEPSASDVPGGGHRQAGQQRALRTGESAARLPQGEQQQQADNAPDRVQGDQNSCTSCVGSDEDGQSGLPVRAGVHIEASGSRCECRRAAARCDQSRWAKVYDILNAGPRHRFTVSGKVVANSNFAAIYELPDQLGFMLSKRIGISSKAGNELATALFGAYTNLLPWMDQKLADATVNGYSVTRWRGEEARHRPLWHLGLPAPNKHDRDKSEDKTRWQNNARSSWNGEAQGSAVDIITSMLWPLQLWLDANTDGGRFVLQIYDSIMVIVKDEDVEKTIEFLHRLMTDNLEKKVGYLRKVPLAIDVKTGKSWGAMMKIKLPKL